MYMTEYETTVVVRPDVSGDTVESTLDRVRDSVKNNGGKLLAIEHWGKKKLAYEIEKHTRGIYVRTHFLGMGGLVAELERNLRINDNVLRFLTVKLAGNVDPSSRDEQAYEQPKYEEFGDDAADEAEEMQAEAAEGAPAADAEAPAEAKADEAKADDKAEAKSDEDSEKASDEAPAAEAAEDSKE